MGMAPGVKSVYPTGKVLLHRPQGAFSCPERFSLMKTKSSRTTEPAKKAPSVNAGRDYAAPLARFSQEEMHALGKEIDEEREQRYREAAAPCPKEYRPAYIHLLKELYADNDDCFDQEDVPPLIHFERSVLNVLCSKPEIDPWDMSEIAECFPQCRDFAEDLRMLSRLRQRERI